MHEQDEESPEEFFPTVESFPDYTGEKREFLIKLMVQTTGYFLRAREKRQHGDEGSMSLPPTHRPIPFTLWEFLGARSEEDWLPVIWLWSKESVLPATID